jgi:hypothetical protein
VGWFSNETNDLPAHGVHLLASAHAAPRASYRGRK